MLENTKKFNIYVFLSTFSRNLIEVFIPLILYKSGYNLKEVVLYYFLVNLFSLIISYPCLLIAKKSNYKVLSIIGIIAFSIMQIMLNSIKYSVLYIFILPFLFALYRRGYWISRRYYNLNVMSNKNISVSYSIISIINQIGVITSAYIGSLILDFISIKVLTVISILLFLISIIPLSFIKIKEKNISKKMELFKTMKSISFRNLYIFGTYELLNVIKFLFPLYLAIYVKNTYQLVGILSLFTNLATLIFAYVYGKSINGKKSYLKLSIFLVVFVYLLKANNTSYWLVLISFLEGIFTKMYEISVNSEFYRLSKRFEYEKYNFAYEITQNLIRSIVTFILLITVKDLKLMIYITLAIIATGIVFKNNYQNKIKEEQ